MPPPESLEAARLAGIRAAQQAWKVYRSVLQGVEGVEVPVFQQALPRLDVRQLVDCSKHFVLRGPAVGAFAAELAGEVSRRLHVKQLVPAVAEGAASAGAAARSMSSQEVTAVTYNFSKLTPQLPEYAVLYNAVADGLLDGTWQLNRLQSVLIGTAFADVELRVIDALPAVLQPVLAELASREEARESITLDELRFLVHASVRSPSLAASDVEVLADCTKRLLPSSEGNFASRAHLAVAWLRLNPPAGCKEVHLEALRSSCAALMDFERSFLPAHPLPREGLATSVAALLAREEDQTAPPLTPPAMGDIIKGLAQISWGLERNKKTAPGGRSLGIDDWAEIMEKTVGFCEAHSTSFVGSEDRSKGRGPLTLPLWAAEVLYHVLWRAQKVNPRADSGADLVELESLLKLLRMVKRHRSKPAPDSQFYSWAAQLVAVHHERTAARGHLAEAVRELVPHLKKEECGNMVELSHELSGISKALSLTSPTMFVGQETARQNGPRLFVGSEKASSSVHLAVSSSPRRLPSEVKLEAAPSPGTLAAPSVALAARASAGGRLWGMLAAHGTTAPMVERKQSQAMTEAPELLVAAKQAELPEPAVSATDAMQKAEETQQLLAKALERVEALEAKLKEQEERREAKTTTRTYSTSARERRTLKASEKSVLPKSLQDSLEESSGWLAGFLPSPVDTIQPSPAAATLHLQRGWKFEDYRRSQSSRLQMERLRVLVPPDHFPMWPVPKK